MTPGQIHLCHDMASPSDLICALRVALEQGIFTPELAASGIGISNLNLRALRAGRVRLSSAGIERLREWLRESALARQLGEKFVPEPRSTYDQVAKLLEENPRWNRGYAIDMIACKRGVSSTKIADEWLNEWNERNPMRVKFIRVGGAQ